MKKIPDKTLKLLLDKVEVYNCRAFISSDPIQIPHHFKRKEDIEISAFLTSSIAWGNRTSIIKNAERLMKLMENSPFDFILNTNERELSRLSDFVHRTFNGYDCLGFVHSLKIIYREMGGLESVFTKGFADTETIYGTLVYFHKIFMKNIELQRTGKHVSDVSKGSAAKRLNMFLRWMVRNDNNGVDFGIWKNIPPSSLMIPLDVHVGNVARKLGLLERKQNDWKAVEELTELLKSIDSNDPVKFDFALFGMGSDNFIKKVM